MSKDSQEQCLKNVCNIEEVSKSTHLAYNFSCDNFRLESSVSHTEDQL